MRRQLTRCFRFALSSLGVALLAGTWLPANAATLCVNPGGTNGCKSSISAAVTAAGPNDTIRVAHGTYHEYVIIKKPLSLVGENKANTIIDATGLSNGIFIDGTAAAPGIGVSNVTVASFTIQNANFEGILVANAEFVNISDNEVAGNDRGFVASATNPACPGIYAFETASDFDCGEGIHLSGARHTTVANNQVENNSGGILISDDTGPVSDNLITGNILRNNPFDCGIVMASHPPAVIAGGPFPRVAPFGVFHNTVAGNTSDHNGTAVEGAGAGVGIFGFLPAIPGLVAGASVRSNVIVNNRLTNNGLPGVAFHAHSPGEDFSNNTIVGNYISGNGQDTEDAATPGPTGINVFGVSAITGTVISQNVFDNEAYDVVVNTPAEVDVHLNNFGNDRAVGIDNLGTTFINATENWWKCSNGPGAPGCTTTVGPNILSTPWATNPF